MRSWQVASSLYAAAAELSACCGCTRVTQSSAVRFAVRKKRKTQWRPRTRSMPKARPAWATVRAPARRGRATPSDTEGGGTQGDSKRVDSTRAMARRRQVAKSWLTKQKAAQEHGTRNGSELLFLHAVFLCVHNCGAVNTSVV